MQPPEDHELLSQRDTVQPLMTKSALRILGSVILVIGIGVACLIFWNAQHPPVDLPYADDLDAQDSRKYGRDMEAYSGKVGVLMQDWIRSAKELGHSEPFALSVAVISIAAGISCFVAGAKRN